MNMLVADDNATNRKLLRVVLEAEGVVVFEAADGVEALAILNVEAVDVVISDVLMPNKDGYELCYELRKAEKLKATPFIFYTNTYTSASSEKLAYEFGADGFIKKPADAETIVEGVRKVVESRRIAGPGSTMEAYPGDLRRMGQYSTNLIGKLEDQNLELEATRERLLKTNHQLLERTKALEQAKIELLRMNERLETRVSARTRDLEDANRELEAFGAAVCHDLTQPLTGIRLGCDMLREEVQARLGAEALENVIRIDHSTERITRVVSALMSLSRVSHMELTFVAVDVTACATEIASELHQESARRVDCRIQPGLKANSDRDLLRILLRNLLGNAWKYSGRKDAPIVEFGALDTPRESTTTFFVRDNGVGFETKEQKTLFQPFHRLKRTEDYPGTGIGLTTALRIVRRHGGRLWAEGHLNEGAAFYFTLEAANASPRKVPTEPRLGTKW